VWFWNDTKGEDVEGKSRRTRMANYVLFMLVDG
jgi:hypothetical protein